MFLSDSDIKKAVEAGDVLIKDFDESRLNPASYDIILDNKFKIIDEHSVPFVDPVNKVLPEYKDVIIEEDDSFILHPMHSVLGITRDYFGSTKYFIHLYGKSSLARIGLSIHHTAPLINPGHQLNMVLELCNLSRVPIILRPGMRIGQIIFSDLSSSVSKDYKEFGRYQDKDWQSYVPNPKEEK